MSETRNQLSGYVRENGWIRVEENQAQNVEEHLFKRKADKAKPFVEIWLHCAAKSTRRGQNFQKQTFCKDPPVSKRD